MEHFKGVVVFGVIVYVLIFALYHGRTALKVTYEKVDQWEATAIKKFSK